MINLNNFSQIIAFPPATITFYLHLTYDLWKCYFSFVTITPLTLSATKSNLKLKKRKNKKEGGEKVHVNKYTDFEGCHHADSSRDLNFYLRVIKMSLFSLLFSISISNAI